MQFKDRIFKIYQRMYSRTRTTEQEQRERRMDRWLEWVSDILQQNNINKFVLKLCCSCYLTTFFFSHSSKYFACFVHPITLPPPQFCCCCCCLFKTKTSFSTLKEEEKQERLWHQFNIEGSSENLIKVVQTLKEWVENFSLTQKMNKRAGELCINKQNKMFYDTQSDRRIVSSSSSSCLVMQKYSLFVQ